MSRPNFNLAAWLKAEARRPFEWGRSDCCLFLADYVRARTGDDPARAWRGAYASEGEARELLAELGGLEGVLALSGWPELEPRDVPCAGDIALARSRLSRVKIPAVRIGLRWYHKSGLGGVAFTAWARGPRAAPC